jgi:GDP-4-dehydro-6-deoxy-D-mannose reductase
MTVSPTGLPLVTGASGFAGGHLLDHLLETEPAVIAWGNPSGRGLPTDGRAHGSRIRWCAVDITDAAAVERALREAQPSIVYHCAGLADVQRARAHASRPLRVNAVGTHAVLAGLERAGLDVPVVVTGSALVYRPSPDVLTEDSPLAPSDPYGVSKLAQELIAAEAPLSRVVIARPFNHAGPRQSDAYVTSSFARQIAAAEAGLRPAVLSVGNLDARRDISDVRDTVRAYTRLGRDGRPRRPYNVCRGEAYRVGDLLEFLLGRARVRMTVEPDPARLRPSDTPLVLGSAARLRADTGWVPRLSIEQTLDDLLEYWRGCIARTATT